jgi:hypothetical protein
MEDKMECKKNENLVNCNCTYPGCPRKGICCECIVYHNAKGHFPACFFSKEAERTFDRSFEKLVEDRSPRNKY